MPRLSSLAPLALVALVACYAYPPAEVDQQLADCAFACERYRDCFDPDFDAFACADRCEALAEEDFGFAVDVASCQTCMEDLPCTAEDFACGEACDEVLF